LFHAAQRGGPDLLAAAARALHARQLEPPRGAKQHRTWRRGERCERCERCERGERGERATGSAVQVDPARWRAPRGPRRCRERRERRDRMIPWRSVFVVAIVVCGYLCCRCLPFPVLVHLLPDRPPHSPFPRSSSPPPRIPSPLRALFLPVIPFSLPPRGPRFVCREGRAINTRLFVTKELAAPFCVRVLGPPSRYCEVATGVPGRCPAFGDQRAGNNEG
jgi:hypothetical protein